MSRDGDRPTIGLVAMFAIIIFLTLAGIDWVVTTAPGPGVNCGNCNITLTGNLTLGKNQTMWVTDAEGSDEISQWQGPVHIAWEDAPMVNGSPAYVNGPMVDPVNYQQESCGKGCVGVQWGGWTPWIVVNHWVPKVWLHVYGGGASTDEYYSVYNATESS